MVLTKPKVPNLRDLKRPLIKETEKGKSYGRIPRS